MGLISTWLEKVGLGHAVPAFRSAGINSPAALVNLEMSDYEHLGVVDWNDKRKLLYLVQRVQVAREKDFGSDDVDDNSSHQNTKRRERKDSHSSTQHTPQRTTNQVSDLPRTPSESAAVALAEWSAANDDDEDYDDEDYESSTSVSTLPSPPDHDDVDCEEDDNDDMELQYKRQNRRTRARETSPQEVHESDDDDISLYGRQYSSRHDQSEENFSAYSNDRERSMRKLRTRNNPSRREHRHSKREHRANDHSSTQHRRHRSKDTKHKNRGNDINNSSCTASDDNYGFYVDDQNDSYSDANNERRQKSLRIQREKGEKNTGEHDHRKIKSSSRFKHMTEDSYKDECYEDERSVNSIDANSLDYYDSTSHYQRPPSPIEKERQDEDIWHEYDVNNEAGKRFTLSRSSSDNDCYGNEYSNDELEVTLHKPKKSNRRRESCIAPSPIVTSKSRSLRPQHHKHKDMVEDKKSETVENKTRGKPASSKQRSNRSQKSTSREGSSADTTSKHSKLRLPKSSKISSIPAPKSTLRRSARLQSKLQNPSVSIRNGSKCLSSIPSEAVPPISPLVDMDMVKGLNDTKQKRSKMPKSSRFSENDYDDESVCSSVQERRNSVSSQSSKDLQDDMHVNFRENENEKDNSFSRSRRKNDAELLQEQKENKKESYFDDVGSVSSRDEMSTCSRSSRRKSIAYSGSNRMRSGSSLSRSRISGKSRRQTISSGSSSRENRRLSDLNSSISRNSSRDVSDSVAPLDVRLNTSGTASSLRYESSPSNKQAQLAARHQLSRSVGSSYSDVNSESHNSKGSNEIRSSGNSIFVHGVPEDDSWGAQVSRLHEDMEEAYGNNGEGLSSSHDVEEMRIRVVVRKRPLGKKETGDVDVIHPIQVNSDNGSNAFGRIMVYQPKTRVDLTKEVETIKFSFDNVFGEASNNEDIYQSTIQHLIPGVFDGQWASVFAYGQTGSGKTFTMMGSSLTGSKAGSKKQGMDENLGLYYLSAQDVFRLAEMEQYKHISIGVSLFEIYSGKLYDLLGKRKLIKCLEDHKGKVCFPGLSEHQISSPMELLEMIEAGAINRSTGSTSANADSSRSHAVLMLCLRKRVGRKANVEHGRLTFIDLAGSERGADTAKACRTTRLEGAEINTSLLALKEVIRAIATGDSMAHIPFRGAKLTQVLKESFVGKNTRTVMVACVAPNMNNVEHTLNTLRYADRVKERDAESGKLSAKVLAASKIKKKVQTCSPSVLRRPSTAPAATTESHNEYNFRRPESEAVPETAIDETVIDEDVEWSSEDSGAEDFSNYDGYNSDDSRSHSNKDTGKDRIVSHDLTPPLPPYASVDKSRMSPKKSPMNMLEETKNKSCSEKREAAKALIATHRTIMTGMLSSVKHEMSLVNFTDVDRESIDDYLAELEKTLDNNRSMIASLRESLMEYYAARGAVKDERSHDEGLLSDDSFEDLRD